MATNEILDGYRFSVICSDPTTPTSGAPVRWGNLTGVALCDESEGGNASGYTTVDFGPTSYTLSVAGVDDNGNSAVAAGDAIFYTDADTPKLSKKASGYFFGFAKGTVAEGATGSIEVMHAPAPGSGTLASGGVTTVKLADNNVTAGKLTATLRTGTIPLDITTMRLIDTNAIPNLIEGGVPDGNTAPSLARVNAATDKALRVIWAATSQIEVQFAPIPKPADLDDTAAVEVHLMIGKSGNTDNSAVVAVGFFDGVGDTNAGGNTAALATASLTEYTVSIAHGDIAAAPGFFNVTLTPGTHANDAIWLYGAWIEYTRK